LGLAKKLQLVLLFVLFLEFFSTSRVSFLFKKLAGQLIGPLFDHYFEAVLLSNGFHDFRQALLAVNR